MWLGRPARVGGAEGGELGWVGEGCRWEGSKSSLAWIREGIRVNGVLYRVRNEQILSAGCFRGEWLPSLGNAPRS